MSEQQQLRLQNHRLKVLQHAQSTGNVAKTCRRYAISRTLFYKWQQRYQEQGGIRNKVLRDCVIAPWEPRVAPGLTHLKWSRRFSIYASIITSVLGAFIPI
jgi:hypothetical protein